MTIYLVNKIYNTDPAYIAFTNKQLAEEYIGQSRFIYSLREIELVTDQFMEQILQSKESHETNTNSSL